MSRLNHRTHMKTALLLQFLIAIASAPVLADERDFCSERPGQTTPPCVLDPGKLMIETAVVGVASTDNSQLRTDAFALGVTQLRYGLTPSLEAQAGWSPYVHNRVRDKVTNIISAASGVGDVTLGLLHSLGKPNGPVAVQAFVTLPVGKIPLGAGDWGAGMRLPVQLALTKKIQFSVTPEIDAAVNGSASGRHIAYGGAAGLTFTLTSKLSLNTDISAFRDEDPAGHTTRVNAGSSLALQLSKNTQFDIGGLAGLNSNSPNIQGYFGIAHRF